MRLLYIHGTPIDSRSANVVQVFNMCQAFAECGTQVTLAISAPRSGPADPLAIGATFLGQVPAFKIVTYRSYTVAGRLNVLGKYFGVRRVLKELGTDLCFVRDPLCLRLAVRAGRPTMFEAHGSHLHDSSRLLGRFWEKDVLANSKSDNLVRFVAISQALADFWRVKGVPKHKLIALHDGFNPRLFGDVKSQTEARQLLGLPMERKIVVYAGSLKPDRGLGRIPQLARTFPDVLFQVVGGAEDDRRYYEALSRREGVKNVQWVGHVPHSSVGVYLHAADVLLMLWTWDVPTIHICSPMKVFEYMASERIIVGEAFPTITEVLRHGETAYLTPPGSFVDLENKLRQALAQEYPSDMATSARAAALQCYSWTMRAQKILTDLGEAI